MDVHVTGDFRSRREVRSGKIAVQQPRELGLLLPTLPRRYEGDVIQSQRPGR